MAVIDGVFGPQLVVILRISRALLSGRHVDTAPDLLSHVVGVVG